MNLPVTITGSYFGTNPSVTVTDPNVIIVGTPSVSPGFLSGGGLAPTQTITIQVSVGGPDPGGPSVLYVTSNGYGYGFTTPPPGGSLSATYPVAITPFQPLT